MTTLAADLADWASTLAFEELPDAVVADCRLRLLDTLAVALAAVETPIGRSLAAARLGGVGPATVIGRGGATDAPAAALINGTLAHALDFDDTHAASVMHPSAPAAVAALAACEAAGGDGRALLRAVAIGGEAACRLGLVAPGAFHAVGLHPTSALGVLAAALAAGAVHGLGAAQLTAALGIAGSMSSGLLEAYSDGSWSKTLHPGWAAHGGLIAVELARAGFTGPASVLEGRYGVYRALLPMDAALDLDAARRDLGRHWIYPETEFKRYPCAHSIHPFVALALKLRTGVAAEDVRAVRLDVPEGFVGQIAEPRAAKIAPRTPTHARASLHYAVAATLADGCLEPAHFEEPAIVREDLRALAARIETRPISVAGAIVFGGVMRLTLADGEERAARAEAMPVGPAANAELVLDKARAIASGPLGRDRAEALIACVLATERLTDLRPLAAALRLAEPRA